MSGLSLFIVVLNFVIYGDGQLSDQLGTVKLTRKERKGKPESKVRFTILQALVLVSCRGCGGKGGS